MATKHWRVVRHVSPEATRRVLAAVQAHIRERGRGPSGREIEKRTGLAHMTVWLALEALRDEYGYVAWESDREGTLRSTEFYP